MLAQRKSSPSLSFQTKEGLEFLIKLGITAGILYLIFQPIQPILQETLSGIVQTILQRMGTNIIPTSNPIQFFASTYLIEISPLCTGILESALLAGAIMATKGKKWKNKLKGIIAGIFLLQTFNIFRIVATIQQLNNMSIEFATLTHDLLFRIVLLVGFAILYAGWLYFPQIKQKIIEKEIM